MAGILPVAYYRNKVYFLFGRKTKDENTNKLVSGVTLAAPVKRVKHYFKRRYVKVMKKRMVYLETREQLSN